MSVEVVIGGSQDTGFTHRLLFGPSFAPLAGEIKQIKQ